MTMTSSSSRSKIIILVLAAVLCAAAAFIVSPAGAIVPGRLFISLDPNNVYTEGSTIRYTITTEGVPLSDPQLGPTFIEVEIRGSRPDGPRGFIASALAPVLLSEFLAQGGTATFTIPNDYATFVYFLRPNVFFEAEAGGSSNFRNSAASDIFLITEGPTPPPLKIAFSNRPDVQANSRSETGGDPSGGCYGIGLPDIRSFRTDPTGTPIVVTFFSGNGCRGDVALDFNSCGQVVNLEQPLNAFSVRLAQGHNACA